MTHTIRRLTLDDESAWADLLAVVFERPHQQMHDLLHFLDGLAPLIAYGAWSDGRLVAQYSCLLRDVIVPDGGRQTAGLSLNMAVHPNHRGRGLVKQIAAPVYERVTAKGGVIGMGFSNAAGVKVDKRSRGYGYQVVGRMRPVIALLTKPKGTGIETEVPSKFQLDSSLEWLEKRFGRHPFRQYQFAYDGDGVVVCRPISWTGGRAVSLLAVHSADVQTTVQRWAHGMRRNGIMAVHLLVSADSTILSVLREVAHCIDQPYCRHHHYLTVKTLQPNNSDDLFQFNRWECVGGDIL